MTASRPIALVGFVLLLLPAPVLAQPVPDEGMVAIGADIGLFVPADEFDSTLTAGGLLEFYLSPRFGLRGSLFWADPDLDVEPDESLRQVRLGVDAIYNWERGKWHPFAGAGLGAHFLELRENGREIVSDTSLGFALLGGVEYFTNRRTTIKGEVRYHVVEDVFGLEPSGLSLSIGLKRYF